MKTRITPAAIGALARGDMENFLVASTPGGIEAQEKRGQIEQSFLETLPIHGTAESRPVWEKLGFVFGEPADDIFVSVKFPKGWTKKVTDHDMWTKLLDDKGRERAAIFYKAAFYDRSARVSLTARFSYSSYDDAPEEGFSEVSIKDGGVVVKVIGKYKNRDYDALGQLEAEAKKWLTDNYPNWQDASDYWA